MPAYEFRRGFCTLVLSLYEHSGGVGQDHVCAIIADSLMSTSNEMCGGFLYIHTMKHCYATALYTQALSVTHARISLPHA